jgi:hypothetical protein
MFRRPPADSIILQPKDSGAGNTVTAIPGTFAEVKFDAHPGTFLMTYSACENPDCPCTDVILTFSERGDTKHPRHRGTEFGVQFNVTTWQVMQLYGENSITKPLIDEFVTGLKNDHKGDILAKYRSFRGAVKNAARFSMSASKIQKGHMASAAAVFGVSKEANSCGLTRPLLEEYQGKVYRLMDSYCINPLCECGAAHLSVICVDKEASPSQTPLVTMRFHFEGEMGLSDIEGSLASQQAARLMPDWMQKDPALLGDIEERYRRIKEIGKRILNRKKKK